MTENNKKCNISPEKLIDFLLEELSLEETAELDNHIRECFSCSAELDLRLNSFNAMREIEMPQVSSDTYFSLKNRVIGKSETSGTKKSTRKESYGQLMSMALSVVAVLFFYNFMITGQVATISIPSNEMSGQEFWAGDTMVTAGAMSTSTPMRDSLAYLSNFLFFPRSIKIASQNIQSKFHFFSTDMISPYVLRSRMISSMSEVARSTPPARSKIISDASTSKKPFIQFFRRISVPLNGTA